ncbi:hypothetical protein DL96DRAFT_1559236 [Flagelloscypha sp. PMI_526]|nr:hypothetical protein DL96DRAFT_1559236 [Flagelloscypha sp. PMI_526]
MATSSETTSSPTSTPGSGLLLTATIAVVGSAMLLWRVRESKVRSSQMRHHRPQSSQHHELPSSSSSTNEQQPLESKGSQASRSKERRKRAKDPFKDLLKNNKKLDKVLSTAATTSPTVPSILVSSGPVEIIHVEASIQTEPLPSPSSPSSLTPVATEDHEALALRSVLSERAHEVETLTGDLETSRSSLSTAQNELRQAKDDLDRARWESTAWHRRCDEMHSQLQNLTHQLQLQAQSYASLYPLQFQPPPHLQQHNGNTSGSASPATGSPASVPSSLPGTTNSQPQSPTAPVPMYHPMMYFPSPPPSMLSPTVPTFGGHLPSGYTTPPQYPTTVNGGSPPIMSPTLIPMPMPPRQQYFPMYQPPPPAPLPPVAESRSRGRKREKRPRTAPAPVHNGNASEAQEQQLHQFQQVQFPAPSASSSLSSTHSNSNSDDNPLSSSSSSSSFGDDYPISPGGGAGEELNALLADAILKRPASFTNARVTVQDAGEEVDALMMMPREVVAHEEVTWPSIYSTAKANSLPAVSGGADEDDDMTPRC